MCDAVLTLQTEMFIRMWDMSRFAMIVLLSLHSDNMLLFVAYKLLVTFLSRDSNSYNIQAYTNVKSTFSDVFLLSQLFCSIINGS